eukprot:jgi/Orpsp1_1/1183170/evm.model.c7180000084177.1
MIDNFGYFVEKWLVGLNGVIGDIIPIRNKSSKSSVKGQFKAAAQQRDSMSFVLKVNKTFIAGYDKDKFTGVAVLNIYNLLCENGNFQNL